MELTMEAYYQVTENHPDFSYIKNTENTLKFEDVYRFSQDYEIEDCISYALHDILLVISGGYQVRNEYFKNVLVTCNSEVIYNMET